MFDLTQPGELLSVLSLHVDQLSDNIPVVHIDGTHGTDLLSVSLAQLSDKELDEGDELTGLFLVVILEGVLVAFF